jgi:NAD(P)-dependent dehydrogenase (short-subunit alcohol dehydrogenase family)
VNNAGILVSKIWDQETFDRTLAVNTKGPIAISQALLPHLAPDALIVMVSSGETQAGRQQERGFSP